MKILYYSLLGFIGGCGAGILYTYFRRFRRFKKPKSYNRLLYLIEKYPNKSYNRLLYLIEKYPNKPWSWWNISQNPNITMEIIEKYPNKPWNWVFISKKPNITMEIIEKNPNKPWDWSYISKNPNLTVEFIERHIDKIHFEKISQNKFTLENKRIKKKGAYWLLEQIRVFNKTQNLVILDKYM